MRTQPTFEWPFKVSIARLQRTPDSPKYEPMKTKKVTPTQLGLILVMGLWASYLSQYGFEPEPVIPATVGEESWASSVSMLVFPIFGTLAFLGFALVTKIWPQALQVRKPQKGLRRSLRSGPE